MTLLILGDCHAAWSRLIAAIGAGIARHGVTAVIQVGDFGFFRSTMARFEDLMGGAAFPVPVHVIDGNHEDHAWLGQQATAGDIARWASTHRLLLHRRGETAVIDGLRIGFLGGALHADRPQQGSSSRGTTNWITNGEAGRAAQAFNRTKPELIVTHSCPHSIGIGMQGAPELAHTVERYITARGFESGLIEDCGEPGLTRLWASLTHRPAHWAFGHFHTHRETCVGATVFHCVGSCDGSDGRTRPCGYLVGSATAGWRRVEL